MYMNIKIMTFIVLLASASSVVAGKGTGAPSKKTNTAYLQRRLRTRSTSPDKPRFGKFTPADKGNGSVDAWGFKSSEVARARSPRRRLSAEKPASSVVVESADTTPIV